MTVEENIAYPLRVRRVPKAERARAVQQVAVALEIEHLLKRRPRQLSGGQRQRIALARAIVRQPSAFLMDEPLSNLDARLRLTMRGEIKRLQHRLGTTTLYVTHDQAEALTMADLVAVMREGVLQQLAPPLEVYERPANRFVATFVGNPPMNVLAAEMDADSRALVVAGVRLPLSEARHEALTAPGLVEIGLRPEDATLVEAGSPDALRGEVYVVEPMGNETLVDVRVGDARLNVRAPRTFDAPIGTPVGIAIDPDATCAFDGNGTTVAQRAGRREGDAAAAIHVAAWSSQPEEDEDER
jgi:multiple sugar transport system ATP-binding protein